MHHPEREGRWEEESKEKRKEGRDTGIGDGERDMEEFDARP